MAESYDAAQRRALVEAARRGEALRCPVCGAPIVRHDVTPRREVSYVRRRVWLICTGCKRTAAIDLPPRAG